MRATSEDEEDTSSLEDSCSMASVGSAVIDVEDDSQDKKFSHVCIVTYWTIDRQVCGVDVSTNERFVPVTDKNVEIGFFLFID